MPQASAVAAPTTERFDWQLVWKAAQEVARDAMTQRWLDYRGEVTQAVLEGRTLGQVMLSPSSTLRGCRLCRETAAALARVEPEQIVDIEISELWWDVTYSGSPDEGRAKTVLMGSWPESHWTGKEAGLTEVCDD